MISDKDFERRFDSLEKRLDSSAFKTSVSDSELYRRPYAVDMQELWMSLWLHKGWVACTTLICALAGAVYAYSLPDKYVSHGIYAPSQKKAVGPLAGQLGGLAAMAGVNLRSGESNDIDQAIVLIKSWPFLEKIVDQNSLKPLIMGVNGWSRETRELAWNEKLYDPVSKRWVRELSSGRLAEPSSYQAYSVLNRMIGVNYDAKTSMLHVSVEHYSPDVAREWVVLLIEQINEAFRARDVLEAKKNIIYLEKKIAETSIAEMQAVLYGMIESQMKTLMLAEVDDEYLVKSIVEPKVSEFRSSPNRKVIILLSAVAGVFLSGSILIGIGVLSGRERG